MAWCRQQLFCSCNFFNGFYNLLFFADILTFIKTAALYTKCMLEMGYSRKYGTFIQVIIQYLLHNFLKLKFAKEYDVPAFLYWLKIKWCIWIILFLLFFFFFLISWHKLFVLTLINPYLIYQERKSYIRKSRQVLLFFPSFQVEGRDACSVLLYLKLTLSPLRKKNRKKMGIIVWNVLIIEV